MKSHKKILLVVMTYLFFPLYAFSENIEGLGSALKKFFDSSKVQKKSFKSLEKGSKDEIDVYFEKNKSDNISKAVFVQKGTYPPNCTHEWAVGVDAKNGKILGVRPLSFSCHHANPTNKPSFLDQFVGKKLSDAKKLSKQITTVTKATGTSELTTKAVVHSLVMFEKYKKELK